MLTVQNGIGQASIQNELAQESSKVNVEEPIRYLMPKPMHKLKLTLKNQLEFCNLGVLHSTLRNQLEVLQFRSYILKVL